MVLPAVMRSTTAARQSAIALEIKQLSSALETYKQQKGEYPPSFGERSGGNLIYGVTSGSPSRYTSAVERHLQRCYPRFTNKNIFYNGVSGGFPGASAIDQGEALTFWLRFVGTNPENPVDMTSTRNVFYEFDERRLVDYDGDGIPTYRPRYCRDTDYIYMESRCYSSYVQNNSYARADGPVLQQVVPYGTNPTTPVNPNTFQIICAGLDGDFGPLPSLAGGVYSPKIFPTGTGYSPADRDNIANFSDGRTLGDARPE
jgi:type II secretory pathway pseudopilin PulG